VGLVDLMKLVQADALTGYSWRLLRCKVYLEQTANDFEKVEKKIKNQDPSKFQKKSPPSVEETLKQVGKVVKKSADKVKSRVEKFIGDVAYSYYSKGAVYKAVQYGKVAIKAAKGVCKIATGVASLVGTGGLSAPVAILNIISGCNDVYNSIIDVAYVDTEQYDKVGTKDFLRDKMKEGGGAIGKLLGNEEVGEKIGQMTYYGIDLVTSMAAANEMSSLSKKGKYTTSSSLKANKSKETISKIESTYDKIKQSKPTDFKQLATELKEIGNMNVDFKYIFTTDVEKLKYDFKLAGYTYKATANFVSNAGLYGALAKDTLTFGDKMVKVLFAGSTEAPEIPVLESYNKIEDVTDKVGKGIKYTSKLTKFVFDDVPDAISKVEKLVNGENPTN